MPLMRDSELCECAFEHGIEAQLLVALARIDKYVRPGFGRNNLQPIAQEWAVIGEGCQGMQSQSPEEFQRRRPSRKAQPAPRDMPPMARWSRSARVR